MAAVQQRKKRGGQKSPSAKIFFIYYSSSVFFSKKKISATNASFTLGVGWSYEKHKCTIKGIIVVQSLNWSLPATRVNVSRCLPRVLCLQIQILDFLLFLTVSVCGTTENWTDVTSCSNEDACIRPCTPKALLRFRMLHARKHL